MSKRSRMEIAGARAPRGRGLVHEEALGFQLRVTWEAMRAALQDRLAAHEIRFAHWSYLRVLWTADGISQNDLSERVRRVGANTVSALNGLQRAGLVKRVRSRVDRRTVYVYLTSAGRALENQLVPLAEEVQRAATRGVSEKDLKSFRRVLATIRVNLGTA
jgi:DNA-binding MarR family transcriptional regulator